MQVHVRNHLTEVLLGVDHPSAVSTLPQSPKDPMALVVVPSDRALESSHGSPEIDLLGPQDQVVMVAHDAPRENRPTIEISNLAKGLDELDRLEVIKGAASRVPRSPLHH